MQPTLIIVLATAAGVPLGLGLRHNLAALGYRNDHELDLPATGPRWWVVWASVFVLASLATVAAVSHDPLPYLSLVPLAITGPWLAAVDFDVLRIPNRVLMPTAAATLLAIVGLAASTQNLMTLIVPIVAAAVTGGALAVIHFAAKGGIGFGDVKLAAAIGLALGSLGATAVWLSVLAGSLTALVWAKASRKVGPISYGPWLLFGTWMSAVATVSLR